MRLQERDPAPMLQFPQPTCSRNDAIRTSFA
jgi:hypothetical protein